MCLCPLVPISSERIVLVDLPYKNCVIPKSSTVGVNNFVMCSTGIEKGNDFFREKWNEDNLGCAKLKDLFTPISTGRHNCVDQARVKASAGHFILLVRL
jgi:hypothetical protein